MSRLLLNPYIMEPTRTDNSLDLFITNNDYLIPSVTSLKTYLSDHNMVDVMLLFNPTDSLAIPLSKHSININLDISILRKLTQKCWRIKWVMSNGIYLGPAAHLKNSPPSSPIQILGYAYSVPAVVNLNHWTA